MKSDERMRKWQKAKVVSRGNSNDLRENYQRQRDLPRLIALWPHEINDETVAGTHKIIVKLRSALRAERQRGRTGHWSYDLDRHLGLVKAYKCEVLALEDGMIADKIRSEGNG